jgi:hypothetical protein
MLNMNLAEGTGIGPGVLSTKGFHHVRIGDSQVCWYKPVIPATQEVESRRITSLKPAQTKVA